MIENWNGLNLLEIVSVGELECRCINCGKNVYKDIVVVHRNALSRQIHPRDLVLVAYGVKAVVEDAYKNRKIVNMPAIREFHDWGNDRYNPKHSSKKVASSIRRVLDVIDHINIVDLNDRIVQRQLAILLLSDDQEIFQQITEKNLVISRATLMTMKT